MSRNFDARARQATAGLKSAMESADLTSAPPMTPVRNRSLFLILRPAVIGALVLIGSAVGVGLVLDAPPPTAPVAPATTTTLAPSTTTELAEVVESTPPTTDLKAPAAVPSTTTLAPDVEPPLLEITYPTEGAELETKTVRFEGNTEPGAQVFSGPYEAEVDSSGRWHIVLILNEGSNVARFSAQDAAGNESTASVTVHYVGGETTTTTEKELAKFKAYATFGSCSETPPYDIYYGKGEPGSLVQITSEYGSGSVEVDGEGNWEKKVIFESAPVNKTFVVTVSDEYGRSAEFEMIHTP